MEFTFLRLFGFGVTYLLFGSLGYRLSRKFKRPVLIRTWVILVLATLFSVYLFKFPLLDFFGFRILVNDSLHALCLGMILGLVIREARLNIQMKNG